MLKTCFSCKKRNLIAEMELMGVWICKDCLKQSENKSKKKKK